jgi:hypothetical protein
LDEIDETQAETLGMKLEHQTVEMVKGTTKVETKECLYIREVPEGSIAYRKGILQGGYIMDIEVTYQPISFANTSPPPPKTVTHPVRYTSDLSKIISHWREQDFRLFSINVSYPNEKAGEADQEKERALQEAAKERLEQKAVKMNLNWANNPNPRNATHAPDARHAPRRASGTTTTGATCCIM